MFMSLNIMLVLDVEKKIRFFWIIIFIVFFGDDIYLDFIFINQGRYFIDIIYLFLYYLILVYYLVSFVVYFII